MDKKQVRTLTAKELRAAKDLDAYLQAVCMKMHNDDLLYVEDAKALALITEVRSKLSAYTFILLSRHMLKPLSQYAERLDTEWHYQCIDALLIYKGGRG